MTTTDTRYTTERKKKLWVKQSNEKIEFKAKEAKNYRENVTFKWIGIGYLRELAISSVSSWPSSCVWENEKSKNYSIYGFIVWLLLSFQHDFLLSTAQHHFYDFLLSFSFFKWLNFMDHKSIWINFSPFNAMRLECVKCFINIVIFHQKTQSKSLKSI